MSIILFAGFGDLPKRLVSAFKTSALRANGVDIELHAIKRTQITHRQLDVKMHYADLTSVQAVKDIIHHVNPTYIVMTLTPDEYSEQGYRRAYVDTTKAMVSALQDHYKQDHANNAHVFFISSTSVYGQNNGEWIDEASPTRPNRYNGKLLIEAEHQLKAVPNCILRCSGLYTELSSRMRDMARQVRHNSDGSEQRYRWWSNRIHRHDVAGFIIHLITMMENNERINDLYILSDNQPEILLKVLQTINASVNNNHYRIDYNEQSSHLQSSAGKRCSNQRMLSTGYQLTYPTYREGYNL